MNCDKCGRLVSKTGFCSNEHLTDAERFDRGLDKAGGPRSCWPWVGARRGDGYGAFGVGGRQIGTHRFAWERAHGPIQNGLWVLHRCDNPLCCNPAHLFLGTPLDNNEDMVSKGRANWTGPRNPSRGVNHFRSVLHDRLVREMRAAHAAGTPAAEVADRFGVNRNTAKGVLKGRTWRHVV